MQGRPRQRTHESERVAAVEHPGEPRRRVRGVLERQHLAGARVRSSARSVGAAQPEEDSGRENLIEPERGAPLQVGNHAHGRETRILDGRKDPGRIGRLRRERAEIAMAVGDVFAERERAPARELVDLRGEAAVQDVRVAFRAEVVEHDRCVRDVAVQPAARPGDARENVDLLGERRRGNAGGLDGAAARLAAHGNLPGGSIRREQRA